MLWKTIDESPAPEVVLLRGTKAGLPAAYERFYGRRVLSVGALAAFLYRVISWSIAVTAHLVAAAILMSIFMARPEEDESLLWASLHKGNAGEEGKAIEEPVFEPPPPVEPPKPEPPQPAPPTPEPPKPDPEPVKVEAKAPVPAAEAPNPVAGPAVDTPKPATIGGGASASGRPAGAVVSDHEVEKDPTAALRRRRAGDLGQLRGGTRKQIVVVTGQYDTVQNVLDKLDVPYTMIGPDRLAAQDLSECRALLVNCHNLYAAFALKATETAALQKEIERLEERQEVARRRREATRDRRTIQLLELELMTISSGLSDLRRQVDQVIRTERMISKLGDFVRGGGYLFTSDWGLTLVEQALPGYIRNGGLVGPRAVDIRARAGREKHPILEEVFYESGSTAVAKKFRWEIDSSSYLIRIERPEVEILVESPQLQKYPAVAVVFSPEGEKSGKVLHVLSHFQKQATQQGDYALQNMLINFLLDRLRPPGPRPQAVGEVAVVPAAPPVVELSGFHQDEQKRFAFALPKGWTASATGLADRPAAMAPEAGSGPAGTVRIGAAPALVGRTHDWEPWFRLRTAELDSEGEGVKVLRKMPAFCCGHPAFQASVLFGKAGARQGALIYAVATPQRIVWLTWTADEARFRELEPAFEKASRSLTVAPRE